MEPSPVPDRPLQDCKAKLKVRKRILHVNLVSFVTSDTKVSVQLCYEARSGIDKELCGHLCNSEHRESHHFLFHKPDVVADCICHFSESLCKASSYLTSFRLHPYLSQHTYPSRCSLSATAAVPDSCGAWLRLGCRRLPPSAGQHSRFDFTCSSHWALPLDSSMGSF